MTYAPPKNGQMDGSTFQTYNCVPAVCVMLVDRATLGAKRPATSRIRAYSGVGYRGLTYYEAADATRRATGVILEPRYGLSRYAVKLLADAGRPFGISIHTAITRWTSRRTNEFVGGHTVYVNHYVYHDNGTRCACELATTEDHGEYVVEDPGTTQAGYLNWSASLVYRAAEYRTNNAGINVLVGRDTEGVGRIAVMDGAIRSKPLKTATRIGRFDAGDSLHVNRTQNGGIWTRDGGGYSTGWHRVDRGERADGYVIGKRLR